MIFVLVILLIVSCCSSKEIDDKNNFGTKIKDQVAKPRNVDKNIGFKVIETDNIPEIFKTLKGLKKINSKKYYFNYINGTVEGENKTAETKGFKVRTNSTLNCMFSESGPICLGNLILKVRL